MEIDPITGLPKDLVSIEDISKESQEILVSVDKRKFGKKYTIVEGFDSDNDLKQIAKSLKSKFSCGGTHKNNHVELQGDYRPKMKDHLVTMGFNSENIIIK